MKDEGERRCGVGFGSNLGDRLGNLRAARDMLVERARAGGEVLSSPVFETEPVDCEEGAPQFLNAVVELRTVLDPEELLEVTQGIERELGRPAEHGFNAPRTVDLDILYVGESEVDTERLVVPHPRMGGRDFVMVPLRRIRGEDTEAVEGMVEVAGGDWV